MASSERETGWSVSNKDLGRPAYLCKTVQPRLDRLAVFRRGQRNTNRRMCSLSLDVKPSIWRWQEAHLELEGPARASWLLIED